MKIREIEITVGELDSAAAFYRDVLRLPVEEQPDRVTVTAGHSRLVMTRAEEFDGVHHVAFGISPHDFDRARSWLRQRVELLVAGDSDIIQGPATWASRSVYFYGPEDIVLEYIARDADADAPYGDEIPQLLSISEVGVSVPDVPAAVDELGRTFGLPRFPPQGPTFAPVGDHDGLLIVVDQDRIWFPTGTQLAPRGPLTVHIDAPQPADLPLTKQATITTAP
jgi:catechol 2,3-dioxygenase-like lactoylglutathione lyase family enzyme